MAETGEVDLSLAYSKCMEFCQALATQGKAFHFSLNMGANFSFSLDTRGEAASSSAKKKKKTPSTLRRNARRREQFLQKKLASPAPVSEKGTEALQKAPTSLHHHPSPPPSSERRQVITVGKGKVPTFNQLDGADSPPAKSAGGEEVADRSTIQDDLVLPHYRGDNRTRIDDSGDRSVVACDNCFHLWRTEEEVDNCECSTHHDCSPYCLFVNVVNKDSDSDL